MNDSHAPAAPKVPICGNCPFRKKAEANPNAWWARLWRWHTTWCPSWKAYQRCLAEVER